MKIAIEGMDGVGKTTIAKKIAIAQNAIYIEKPLSELFALKDKAGKEVLAEISNKIYTLDEEIIKAWFFGMGNLYTFIKYEKKDLIIDRHFASNYFWNGSSKTDPIFQLMIDLIGVPDLTIVLYASVNTRLKRLYKRNANDYDLKDPEKHVFGYDKIFCFLEKFKIPYVVVNTENKTEEEVYNETSELINNLKRKNKRKLLLK